MVRSHHVDGEQATLIILCDAATALHCLRSGLYSSETIGMSEATVGALRYQKHFVGLFVEG